MRHNKKTWKAETFDDAGNVGYQIEPFFINLVKTAQNPSSTYRNKQALKKKWNKTTHIQARKLAGLKPGRLENRQARKQASLETSRGHGKKFLFSLSLFPFLYCTKRDSRADSKL